MKKIIIPILILVIIGVGVLCFILFRKKDNTPKVPEKDPKVYEDSDFNIRLLKTINSTQQSNYLVSPYSIEIALQMLKQGSNGSTLDDFNNVLPARKIETFQAKDRIGVANALFLKDTYEEYIEKDFVNKLNKNYQAEVILDRFNTPNKINNWVKDHTYKMIPKVLDDIGKDFVLGLANAIAIDVEWTSPFECELTKEETFTKSNNETMNVEMMHKHVEGNAEYFETEQAKGIILPYKSYNKEGEEDYQNGTTLEFVGILPNNDVSTYIESLTREELASIDNNIQRINDELNVKLSIPRFKYDFELEKFKEVLVSMGLSSIFDQEQADFTHIITRENMMKMNTPNIYVNKAIHKHHIEFSEKGTKAAAVTYFGMAKATAVMKEPRIIKLDFNKPFVYMIRESETKEILFFGVVQEPNKWQKSTCK